MRLSDAMRGAADRAPVEDATVSTADAARRVTRSRRLHTGANALVGAGAVAVIGMAFVGGVGASDDSAADTAMAGADEAREESTMEMDSGEAFDGSADSMIVDQWMCGSDFTPGDGAWSYGDSSGVTYEVGDINSADDIAAAEGEYLVPETYTAHRPVALLGGSDYVITWDGIVVGRSVQPSPILYGPADEPQLPAGEAFETLDPDTDFSSLQQAIVLDPVNCWDGAPLPPGQYEVHVATTLAYPIEAPADEPDSEPTASTGESPAETSGEPDAGITDEDGTGSSTEAADPEVLPAPGPEIFRVAGGPVILGLEGDMVDDPFGAYLGTVEPEPEPGKPGEPGEPSSPIDPVEPAPLPDNALTPDVVRQMFAASEVAGGWDMEAGSHRWLMNDSAGGTYSYFGCTWGSSEGASFPERSSTMDLLDLDVTAPRSLGVSYGFVVDDNPEVDSTVTNTSQFDIYNYWGSAQPQLYLARDGRIVAEGYPVSLQRDEFTTMDGAAESLIWPAPDRQALAAGQSVSGTFLWRDVTRCDSNDSRGTGVEAGTYTLLASTSLSVSDPEAYAETAWLEEDTMDSEAEALARETLEPAPSQDLLGGTTSSDDAVDGGGVDAVEPSIGIAPIDEFAWVDLQLWTSLGTVSVTT